MNTKKWLQKKLEHSQFDGIIHYGNNGEKKIDLIVLLNDYLEDELKAAYDKGLKDGYACMPRNIE